MPASLNGLDDECCKLPGSQPLFKRFQVVKRNRFRVGQQRAEASSPEWISHQGERAASEPVKGAVRIEQSRGGWCVRVKT